MEMKDVDRLPSPDEDVAKEAFDRLYPAIRQILEQYLIPRVSLLQDREEIVVKSCERIWHARHQFKPISIESWLSHIRRLCRWAAIDHLRTKRQNDPLIETGKNDPEIEEIESDESEFQRRLYDLADQVWLGWDSTVPPVQRNRQVLAAQLFFLHGQAWDKVAAVARLRPDMDRSKFDQWLEHEPTLLHMAFREVYAASQELTDILLGTRATMSCAPGDEILLNVDWTKDQVEIIRHRFLFGHDPAERMKHVSKQLIEETIEACLQQFPFCDRLERVKHKVTPSRRISNCLTRKGLWKRVVFHYCASMDRLEHKHILERVAPSATACDQRMDGNTLQAWWGSGRLADELIKHYRKVNS